MSKITVTTIAGATSGADANKVKIESGDTLQVESNATVGGTLTTTGTLTANGLSTLVGSTTHGTDAGDTRFNLNGPNQYRAVFKHAGNIAGQIGGGGADDLRFSNAAGATTMSIKDGRVTIPNQPCFSATHPTGSTLTTDGTYRVKPHNTIVTNIGGGYSTAGGGSRFTAPVAGTYIFYCFALQLANISSMIIFGKNGSHTTHGTNSEARAISPSGTELNIAFQLILTLAENDYVEVFYRRTAGSGGFYSAHGGFSGFLIG